MNITLKIIAILLVGIFIFYACGNKTKSLESPSDIADAIRKNDTDAISTWLKNGGNPNQAIDDSTPLYIATGPKGGHEMVQLLLENGAKVNEGAGKYTPLMNAASWVDLTSVKLLLQNGADKNLTNERGDTAYDVIGDCGNCPEQSQLKNILKIISTVHYLCEKGEELHITFEEEKAKVKIISKNQPTVAFTGTRVPSGSGEKFEGEGYTYWTKGEECFIMKGEELIFKNCSEVK